MPSFRLPPRRATLGGIAARPAFPRGAAIGGLIGLFARAAHPAPRPNLRVGRALRLRLRPEA
ncbi:MAG: hypothetical protein K2X11_12005, partial [Acetobacteraceae bacterium]|nr:hypothetical protein [Acetobacteraceae bacterium]